MPSRGSESRWGNTEMTTRQTVIRAVTEVKQHALEEQGMKD